MQHFTPVNANNCSTWAFLKFHQSLENDVVIVLKIQCERTGMSFNLWLSILSFSIRSLNLTFKSIITLYWMLCKQLEWKAFHFSTSVLIHVSCFSHLLLLWCQCPQQPPHSFSCCIILCNSYSNKCSSKFCLQNSGNPILPRILGLEVCKNYCWNNRYLLFLSYFNSTPIIHMYYYYCFY